jgi:hypothetical protein
MDIGELGSQLNHHVERLRVAREEIGGHIAWYPYKILANVVHLDGLLQGEYRDLDRLAQGRPVADIGAADGDLASPWSTPPAGRWTSSTTRRRT